MIVECIGTPGAGKTTLLPVLADFFQAQGLQAYTVVEAARPFAARTIWGKLICKLIPARWQQPLLWQLYYHLSKLYQVWFFMQHPRLIWMVFRFQRRRPIDRTDRQHVLFWFFRQTGSYAFLKAHARPNEVLLFDEGFIHRVVQNYASEGEEPNLFHMLDYIDLLPQPDLVVHPVADRFICEERVYARGLWQRFQHKSRAEISRYIMHADMVVQEAVEHIKRRGWTIVEVNNDNVETAVVADMLHYELTQLPQIVITHTTVEPPKRSLMTR